ncbi:MAG: zinc ribbon domain-containing protein [Acidobacteria bacterium]|nr:zinc ribbon domain-containing protein [Acidobacteriota bacterium]
MPLYEYQCRKCGVKVEKIQKFSAPTLGKCEKCGGTIERLLCSPAIQFKGSGWYVTDYARKSSAPAGSNGSSPKSDSKTESAAPAAPAPSNPVSQKK